MLEQALADAQNQPLCDAVDASSDSTTPGETSDCSAIFTSTGVSWDCPNGELFNAAIEDMSSPGVYPLVECASSGSFTVAEGQQFWFNFYLVNGTQTFIDGWNTDREQNVPIGFSVPEDTEGVCAQSASDEPKDYSTLPYSTGSFTPDKDFNIFTFVLTEETQVAITANSFATDCSQFASYIAILRGTSPEDWTFTGVDAYSNLGSEENCNASVVDTMLGADTYLVYVANENFNPENPMPITVNSSIELTSYVAPAIEIPETQFSFKYEKYSEKSLVLEESTEVVLTTSAVQNEDGSCPATVINVFNAFGLETGPYSWQQSIAGASSREWQPESGPCSAAVLNVSLEAGTYLVRFQTQLSNWGGTAIGDGGPGEITVGSSNELTVAPELKWNFTTQTITPEQSYEVVVPAGGAWFRAEANTKETESYSYDSSWWMVAMGGCANPDGDVNTSEDWNCTSTLLTLLDSNGNVVNRDMWGGQTVDRSTTDGILTETFSNTYSSVIQTFLAEGTYTLVAGSLWSQNPYELNFGFGDAVSKIIVTPVDTPVLPETPKTELPSHVLTDDGSSQISISSDIEFMVCDAGCIDALFAAQDLTDGSIQISVGGEHVTVAKGQKYAVIPVGKLAGSISVTGKSADGSKTGSLSVQMNRADAAFEKTMKDKIAVKSTQSATESSSGSSTSIYIYVLIALLILVAIGYMRRKKATETK